MNLILKELEKSSKYNDFIKNLENKKSPIAISGLTGVAEASIIAKCLEQTKRPIFIITYNEIQAQALVNDLKFFTEDVAYLPKKEIITYDYVAESKNLPYERIEILNKIYKKQKLIIVTSVETIKQKIISKDTLYKNVLKFKVGDRCDLEVLKQKLVDLGYQRFDLIDGRGEFSVRGGIIDISTTESIGIRIELWGDEIDSIRHFNIISQRSIDNIEKIEIFPAHEYILETSIEKVAKNISNNVYPENISEKVESDLEKIRNVEYISKIDRYFNSFYGKQETVLEYIDDKYLVFVDEFNKVIQRSENIEQDNENTIKALMEKGRIIPDSLKNYVATENLESNIEKYQTIYLDKLDDRIKNGIERYDFKYKELNYFKSGIDLFINDINNFKKQEKKVYIVVDTKEKANKMEKLLAEYDILSIYYEKLNKTIINQDANTVIITLGKISKGFYSIDLNQVVMIASDLVDGTRTIKKRKSETFKQGEKVVFADLKVGDYVVHRRYGIGIYIGVNTITADGTTRDYLKLKYSGDDILYIPTNSLDEIRKYVGGEELNLKLNKLGSKDWEKTTNKVRNNLRAVAKELIELYARREKSKGYAFSKDTEWQKQFEEAFPYVETDDQLRCIDEVKKDMENEKPMDRLLCGDVGYGKTEVAIRAAFKAVMDHKQVAYLAPTTVLAKQQYETFKERMKDFPIRVDVLNRFRTTKDKNRIIKKMKLGEIDILIGTQMVVKGHHFPKVTLVGVIAADSSLNIDDYRATERTFQILTQVAGRAGRENLPGKVIIQTYNPENFSIQDAQKQNYQEFYETEIALRKQLKYPPFCDIIIIGFNSLDENEIKKVSNKSYEYLIKKLNNEKFKIFKPMPSPIDKIQNRFRWRIIIKGNMNEQANEILNDLLKEIYSENYKNTKISVDVNPNSMM